jgi:hypothetical protein
MTNGQKFAPMLKAGGLWAKTSAKGGRCVSRRLGGVKTLILANRDCQNDDDPSHHLFFVEAPDRRQGAQERGGGQRAPQASKMPPQPQRSGFQGHAGVDDDDAPEWA